MKYGCIGEHLKHSFSKEIHNALCDYEYEIREIPREELAAFMEAKEFTAINVTIPYKEAVIPYLYYIDDFAKEIGAVNTIVNRDGKLYGYNTDFYGMTKLLRSAHIYLRGKKVAILGTGGTSKTAFAVARAEGANEIIKVSRSAKEGSVTYEELYEKHADTDIIINTTPLGMYPNIFDKAVDISRFENLTGVADAIYNPLRTQLVSDGYRKIAAEGGLYMLVAQAVRASEIFLDKEYPKGTIDKVFDKIYNEKENVVLIGMPGSGKTTVGKIVADNLGREFIDTDEMIVKKAGMPITEIFERFGEKYFRDLETECIKEASTKSSVVIATGGGGVLREENIKALRMNGCIYFIDRPLKKIMPTDSRPLSSSREALEKRYNERYGIYCTACDVSIDASVPPRAVAGAILKNKGVRKLYIINGPNLNMLGIREPDTYGKCDYEELCDMISAHAKKCGIEAVLYQSNHEGDLVDKIQEAYFEGAHGIVINPGAYTHTSIAILDAVKATKLPCVEVHISKVEEREDFRQISYIREASIKTITGHGVNGYIEGIDFLLEYLRK